MKLITKVLIVLFVLISLIFVFSKVTHQRIEKIISSTECNFNTCLDTIQECECFGLVYNNQDCKGIKYQCKTREEREPRFPQVPPVFY